MDLEDWLAVGSMFLTAAILIKTLVYLFQLMGY